MHSEKTPLFTADEVRELLDYEPETGVFLWRADRRPGIKAGDIAGSIDPVSGRYLLTVKGKTVRATTLAWLYMHGEWPELPVRPINGSYADARFKNLKLAEPARLSTSKTAVYARNYRARAREERTESHSDDIQFSERTQKWRVHIPGHPDNVFLGSWANWGDACRHYFERLHNLRRLQELPVPKAPGDYSWQLTTAGPKGISLAMVHNYLCYDPDNGALYLRQALPLIVKKGGMNEPREPVAPILAVGRRADILTHNKRRVLRYGGRDYPVAMLAVFMRTGKWPDRKSVTFRDGDPSNTRWSNLDWEGAPEPENKPYYTTREDRQREPNPNVSRTDEEIARMAREHEE